MLYLLNGPPRSGKDTVGAIIASAVGNCLGLKLAAELKERAHEAYRLHGLPHDYFEEVKEEPTGEFHGLSPRQVYIDFHERYLKPVHGPEILGLLLLARLRERRGLRFETMNAVVTDAGDDAQCLPLVEVWGADNTTLIRLEHPKATWTDNRRPFDLPGVRKVHIFNPGDATVKTRLTESLPELRGRV